jgi:uncharacterized membrane protein
MSGTALGLLSGLALGLTAAFGGFTAFLLVLVFAAIGVTVGRVADGKLDLAQLLGRERD